MECLNDHTSTYMQEYLQFYAKRYARMQLVVILEAADIEWNRCTGGALYWRYVQLGRKWSLESTKGSEHVSVKNSVSEANILLGQSVIFLFLWNVPPQLPTFLDAPAFAVDDASARLPCPVIG